ncbi:MAG: 1-deoxy-D-xylulose-5-phosphate synthase [Candidatus Omnitrophota bacterium]|nr:MAG: 1-deoxy-D-xylulose-5-phosphate synthase [Candidatus Omnitrophota bacterium]
MSLLEQISNPADLKKLALKELSLLAQEIRREIIATVSVTGGHLASSLGAVELAIALHYCLDTPKDKIVWDVGHQAYAHKILTGRRERLKTLRQWQGISGFPNKEESVYDTFTTGHGSTSISTALGLACADTEKNSKVVAVIGDAALGGGMAFEALNHAGQLHKDLVVVLNDNKMAISKSVGALSRYLNRILTMPIYNRIRQDIENLVKRVPRLGNKLFSAAKRLEESLKNLLVPGIIFEELGFRYFGPIDGHNVKEVVRTLRNVLKLKEPVLIHAVTVKGKGYSQAERIPEKFHGISANGGDNKVTNKTFTQVFSEKLISLAQKDEKIAGITAAMAEGTGLDKFAQSFPKRFYDVGMAEAHAVGFAAGLARRGLRPFVAIYSTFLQRSYDQLIHDVCLQSLPVVLCLDRAGIVGEDGATHQGIFDVAYLRHIPNLTLLAPKDGEELEKMLEFASGQSRPLAIRYPKGEVPQRGELFSEDYKPSEIQCGKAEVLRRGKDLAIVALGSMVYPALEAARILSSQGIDCTVINARFVKPLDGLLFKRLCIEVETIVTVEEGVAEGGFGSAVLEFLEREGLEKVRVIRIALPSVFIPHAKREFLLEKHGLSAEGIVNSVLNAEIGLSAQHEKMING